MPLVRRRPMPSDHGARTPSTRIDRSCFLRDVLGHTPGLARYGDLCCTYDSFVLFGAEKIPSRRWVQQEDHFGPSLFALGLRGVVSEGRSTRGGSRMPGKLGGLFYHDSICGADDRGFQLNAKKCERASYIVATIRKVTGASRERNLRCRLPRRSEQ